MDKSRGNRESKLVHISDINEEMKLVEGSEADYITPTGKVYKWYHDDMYYPKKVFQNKNNKYMYVNITFKDGKIRSRRQHILLAKAFIPNPDPEHYNIVGHKDDVKWHNDLSNLYWTNNQENTQSAINNGLNVPKKAEENQNSIYIKVLDKDTKEIVGVYGSLRECERCIDNIDLGCISKLYKKENYKPRFKKYIYQYATKQEFKDNIHLRSKHLVENKRVDKKPKIFYLINDNLNYKELFDNQVAASKVCGILQSQLSHMIKYKNTLNGWRCEYVGTTDYINSSAYQNLVNIQNQIVLQNIKNNQIKIYPTASELKEDLNIRGHDIRHYLKSGHILLNEWKIIAIESKDITNDSTTDIKGA